MGQACEIMNVSRKTLRGYCYSGAVKANKLPGTRGDWRILEHSIIELMSNCIDIKALELAQRHGL